MLDRRALHALLVVRRHPQPHRDVGEALALDEVGPLPLAVGEGEEEGEAAR